MGAFMAIFPYEGREDDTGTWKPATQEERDHVAALIEKKLLQIRVMGMNHVPRAYFGFLNPCGSLGSHVPRHPYQDYF